MIFAVGAVTLLRSGLGPCMLLFGGIIPAVGRYHVHDIALQSPDRRLWVADNKLFALRHFQHRTSISFDVQGGSPVIALRRSEHQGVEAGPTTVDASVRKPRVFSMLHCTNARGPKRSPRLDMCMVR